MEQVTQKSISVAEQILTHPVITCSGGCRLDTGDRSLRESLLWIRSQFPGLYSIGFFQLSIPMEGDR